MILNMHRNGPDQKEIRRRYEGDLNKALSGIKNNPKWVKAAWH
jgi:hypothetical protein